MKIVTAAIIKKDDKVLLARRKRGQNQAGYWEFPGGKLEAGESLKSCLKRELYEELGIDAQIGFYFTESQYQYDHGVIQLVAFWTSTISDIFKLTVHDKIIWVPVQSLLKYQLSPADIPIAQKLILNCL